MRVYLAFSIVCASSSSFACVKPAHSELVDFFEGSSHWTEVKDSESFEIAPKRPVFLQVPLKRKDNLKIRWGDNQVDDKDLSVCWAEPEKKTLLIRRFFFKTRLIKVKKGLLKSWIPIDGDLYYRQDNLVQRPSLKRQIATQKPNLLSSDSKIQSLTQYYQKKRILLVSNNSKEKAAIQKNWFHQQNQENQDRQLLWIAISQNDKELFSKYGFTPGQFELLLIGKDGLIKQRYNQPTPMRTIYDLIDAM